MNTETVTPADLAAESAPPATVTPAAPAPESEPTPAAAVETDAINRPFDAVKFLPRKDSAGRWINKNAGRKPRSPEAAQASGKSFVPPDAAAPAPGPSGTDRYDLAAELYCRASYSTLDGIFSANGEWLPESDGEHVGLRNFLAAWLRARGSDDLPPNLAFALAAIPYGATRMTKPNTLSRIRLFVFWIRSRWFAFRTGQRLAALPEQPPAPPSEQMPLPPQPSPAGPSTATLAAA
jgi:hypothetical protein